MVSPGGVGQMASSIWPQNCRLPDKSADSRQASPSLVGGQTLYCGHYLPEEAPVETEAAIRKFLAR